MNFKKVLKLNRSSKVKKLMLKKRNLRCFLLKVPKVIHGRYSIIQCILFTKFGITKKLIANQFNSKETICLSFYAIKRLFGDHV